jgi:hypothetical protein
MGHGNSVRSLAHDAIEERALSLKTLRERVTGRGDGACLAVGYNGWARALDKTTVGSLAYRKETVSEVARPDEALD